MTVSRYAIHKARKQYTCTEASYHTIHAGDLYLYAACPPWHDASDGRKWWIIRACLHCAEKWGLHNSDTRRQLAEIQQKGAM